MRVGGVAARQRRGLVDARILAVDEALPADLLQVGELQVRPRLDALGDVLAVLRAIVLGVLLAGGAGDANLAVVEVRAVLGIDHAHVVGLVDVDVAGDELDVLGVLQDDVVKNLEREPCELDRLAAAAFDLLALLLVDAAADSAGQAPVRMYAAAAHHLDQGVAVVPHLQDVLGHIHADLGHDAEDVAFGWRRGGTDDEIGAAEGVEVRGVVGGVEDAVEQLAEFLATGGGSTWNRASRAFVAAR